MIAYRYDRVNRLSPIFYVETAIQMLFDTFIFKVSFSTMQLIGFLVVLAMFLVIIIMAYVQDSKRNKAIKTT